MLHGRARLSSRAAALAPAALLACCLTCAVAQEPAAPTRWPGWRGDGSGVSAERPLPMHWDASRGVAWKTRLAGQGNSSPIVWGGRVFLTASADEGKRRTVLCLSAADGAIRWQKHFAVASPAATYPKNGYASPTPVTDGERVYAFFDEPGLVALDLDGKDLWTCPLGPFRTSWNLGASPVLHGDLVILVCDHDGGGFIAGVEKATGKVRWRTARPGWRAFAAPLVVPVGDKAQVVVNGRTIFAYDPADGTVIWSCRGMKETIVPSPVFHDALVYVASGRNGPVLAIDPTGRGDVTESRATLLTPVGGPYVVSPIFCGALFLTGDNGSIRVLDVRGGTILRHRLGGHFSASPAAGDGKLYWTNEKGETCVLDAAKAAAGRLDVLAVNPLGERCLASPAIAGARIYLRTDQHLFCIAGTDEPTGPPAPGPARGRLDELAQRYGKHPAAEGPDVTVRLEAVEAIAALGDTKGIDLLLAAAQKDNHWDVSEAAAKGLVAQGPAAEPALIELLAHRRGYLKVIAAEALGKLASSKAVKPLADAARHRDPLVRMAALGALTQVAGAHKDHAAAAVGVLAAALNDGRGVVVRQAVEHLAALAAHVGASREEVVASLLEVLAGANPSAARAAREALAGAFQVSTAVIAADELLYGAQRPRPSVEHLSAGPIRLKFQDGELRYLYVGERQVVRRIYFAVRDRRWDTVMPALSRIQVQKDEKAFRIRFSARCRSELADYGFSADIAGTADGRITFRVRGQADADFRSPRIGLCVLYGAESLAGVEFETTSADGKTARGRFAELVSPGHLAGGFRSLQYKTADGVEASCGLAKTLFTMEDQRNFGDSSYKAFSAMPYKRNVARGDKGEQTLTLRVTAAAPPEPPAGPIAVQIGGAIEGAKVPALPAPQASTGKPDLMGFLRINQERKEYADAAGIAFPYNPAAHMPDDDTFMENRAAVADQVRTVRSFAPKAKVRIDPITIDSPYPRPGPDARNAALFAAAWAAGLVRHLAAAGADEAIFKLGDGPAEVVRRRMAGLAGKPVLSAEVTGGRPAPVEALAVRDGGTVVVWLSNSTDEPRAVVVEGLAEAGSVAVWRLNAETVGLEKNPEKPAPLQAGKLPLTLGPFEVCRVAAAR